jgi:hypothetical protein
MSDQIKRLTCPAEDAEGTISLDSQTPADLVRWIASRLGLRYKEVGDKAMLGLPATKAANGIPNALAVPYFAQLDSATDQGPRMCFSSSCAMLAKFLKPGALGDGKNADDEYLSRVRQYGDTTEAGSQLKALAHLGVKAVFRQDLGWKDLDKQLLSGKPVPIGILHRGHVSAPTGGGHWIVVIGKQGESYRVHDPAGDLDLVSGQYMGNNGGKGLLYSKANLGPRWMADGPGTGWGILA